MKKTNVKKEIDQIYNEVIDHKGLPSAYRVGMTVFKNRLLNFISSDVALKTVGAAVWTSVKEKKPRHLKDVLMGENESGWVCSGYYNSTEKKWYNSMQSEADEDADCYPSHWMELPKPPSQ